MMKRALRSTGPGSATGLVVSGTALIAVTYGAVRYGFGLQLPVLAAELGLSSGRAGAIAAGSFAAYCVAALTAQRLIGRRGARPALWAAAALASAGAVTVALAGSAASLTAGVLVAGGAAGAASPAMVVAVASSVRRPHAARAQAVVNAGTGIGVAVTGIAVLAAPQAWRPVWAAAAVGVLLTALVVDRRAAWPAPVPATREPGGAASLRRACVAAAVAGLGSAAVWTFGRDLVTTTGGLPGRTTAALWVLLGTAAVLGALSGDTVRVLGLRHAWTLTAALSALGTALLALAPGQVAVVALAAALFGGAYTALSGVLIAWAGAVRPGTAGQATATLFVALTGGQAVGAAATGVLADRVGTPAAFWVCAAVLLVAAWVRPAAQASPSRSRIQESVKARRAQAW